MVAKLNLRITSQKLQKFNKLKNFKISKKLFIIMCNSTETSDGKTRRKNNCW